MIRFQNDWVNSLLDLDFNYNDYCDVSDEQLVSMARTRKSAASVIISRYSKLISVKSEMFANSNTDSDDLNQEGLIGLLNAVSSFDSERGVKFSTFAEVCISNRMKSLLAKNQRAASKVEDIDLLSDEPCLSVEETPESILLDKEFFSELLNGVCSVLSATELKVFRLCLDGKSYRQAAVLLGITEKSVDNAMQRARKKIRGLMQG